MRMLFRAIVGLLFLSHAVLGWTQASTPQPTNLPLGSAVVSDVKGEVFVTPAGQSASDPAQKGQILAPNTTVECKKGSVLLNLADGSQVLVKPNTRVILRVPDEAKGNFLEQLIGKITATVKKRTGNEPAFKMGTPTAVITVRGTIFTVEVSKHQQTWVQVIQGLVEVDGIGKMGRPVFLQPGYVTQVGVNSAPANPRKLFPDGENGDGSFSARSGRESDSTGRAGKPSSSGSGGTEVDH